MKLEIEYTCEHLTCRMPCHTGKLIIEEQKFKALSNAIDSSLFTSPSKACKIGFNQQFRIVSKKESQAEDEVLITEKKLTLEERVKALEEQSDSQKLQIETLKEVVEKLSAQSSTILPLRGKRS